MARRLAAQGASVLLHANSRPDAVQALAESIAGAGGEARTLVFDLGDDAATRAA
jgi:3-oxoacyl-[acyl-carrier protein] reductase